MQNPFDGGRDAATQTGDGLSVGRALLLGLAALPIIAVLDWVTGPEISFSIFYLLPVAVMAWSQSRWLAAVGVLISAAIWYAIDSGTHPGLHPAVVAWNALVRLTFFAVVATTLTRIREMLRREYSFARVDPLTGAANSRHFHEQLTAECARQSRTGRPLVVAYVDLDNFKAVNDRHGHLVGDEALRTTVGLLRSTLRTNDTVARIGGDEFALLLPETDFDHGQTVLNRILPNLRDAMAANDWPVTASVGAVACTKPPESANAILKRVDDLVYQAKRQGKDCIVMQADEAD